MGQGASAEDARREQEVDDQKSKEGCGDCARPVVAYEPLEDEWQEGAEVDENERVNQPRPDLGPRPTEHVVVFGQLGEPLVQLARALGGGNDRGVESARRGNRRADRLPDRLARFEVRGEAGEERGLGARAALIEQSLDRLGDREAGGQEFSKFGVERALSGDRKVHALTLPDPVASVNTKMQASEDSDAAGGGGIPGLRGADDARWMARALELAAMGKATCAPNPAVGAVIVHGVEAIGEGFHARAGGAHAEVAALAAVPDPLRARLPESTLYVTLEPCSTTGRTPPCTEAIMEAGIGRVVVGAADPNPAHAGRGLDLLREKRVDVRAGVHERACRELNEDFNKWIVTGRPWVIVKAGISLDGRITRPAGESQWLTCEESRTDAHRLRRLAGAILVGAETVRRDNPRLTVRLEDDGPSGGGPVQPWRVVLTRSGDLPSGAHLFTDAHHERTLVFKDKPIPEVLADLGKRGIIAVLVEGGGEVIAQVLADGLADRVVFYIAPMVSGASKLVMPAGPEFALPASVELEDVRWTPVGTDMRVSGKVGRKPDSI